MADDVTVPGQTPALPTADDATGPTVEELQAQLAERDRALQERERDLKVYKDTLTALGESSRKLQEITVRSATMLRDASGAPPQEMVQRLGEYDRARELYGDALALFAAVKNSELQLYVLYNMANLDRERRNFSSGAELYEATASLAQRIGQIEAIILRKLSSKQECLDAFDPRLIINRNAVPL